MPDIKVDDGCTIHDEVERPDRVLGAMACLSHINEIAPGPHKEMRARKGPVHEPQPACTITPFAPCRRRAQSRVPRILSGAYRNAGFIRRAGARRRRGGASSRPRLSMRRAHDRRARCRAFRAGFACLDSQVPKRELPRAAPPQHGGRHHQARAGHALNLRALALPAQVIARIVIAGIAIAGIARRGPRQQNAARSRCRVRSRRAIGDIGLATTGWLQREAIHGFAPSALSSAMAPSYSMKDLGQSAATCRNRSNASPLSGRCNASSPE